MSKESDSRNYGKEMRYNALDAATKVVNGGIETVGEEAKDATTDFIKWIFAVCRNKLSQKFSSKVDSNADKVTEDEMKEFLKVKKMWEELSEQGGEELSEKEVDELSEEEFQEYFTKKVVKMLEKYFYSCFEDGLGYGENRKEYAMTEAMKKNGFNTKQIQLVLKEADQIQQALNQKKK
jgi:hypothetical protein